MASVRTRTQEFNHADGVTLEKHFDMRYKALEEIARISIKALEDKIEMQFKMSQEAILKAENTMNFRLEGMNEFRAQSKDREETFATKQTTEANHKAVLEQIRSLETQMGGMVPKISWEGSQTIHAAQIRTLELDKAKLDGKADQTSVEKASAISARALTFSIISVLFGATGIIFALINLLSK